MKNAEVESMDDIPVCSSNIYEEYLLALKARKESELINGDDLTIKQAVEEDIEEIGCALEDFDFHCKYFNDHTRTKSAVRVGLLISGKYNTISCYILEKYGHKISINTLKGIARCVITNPSYDDMMILRDFLNVS
ncbi:unnamed protein product [marine sediment metagenome]|uniref:Uncharacterized protein n=1 Tax=marine sediment metagenome TaxID=412755 RepID=X0RG59_9ZZZZ